MSSSQPVRVAVVNDFEVVVEGVAAMLRRHPDRVAVLDAVLLGQPIQDGPVDVALYDTYGHTDSLREDLDVLTGDPSIRHVAVFSLAISPDMIADAKAAGACSFITKSATTVELLDALTRTASGEEVFVAPTRPARARHGDAEVEAQSVLDELDWPGKDLGLTERESQVLALVAEGLTNAEIGERLYLGAETIKTYLRQASNKLGFRNRVQAAAWVATSSAFARRIRPVA